jgi:hypothetical protein
MAPEPNFSLLRGHTQHIPGQAEHPAEHIQEPVRRVRGIRGAPSDVCVRSHENAARLTDLPRLGRARRGGADRAGRSDNDLLRGQRREVARRTLARQRPTENERQRLSCSVHSAAETKAGTVHVASGSVKAVLNLTVTSATGH